jgi:flagellum-specific peptidoglycan hydrolase FlgJ
MTQHEQDFFTATVPAAQACEKATGVPASVTLAQAILESGWGASEPAQKANNYFGIKSGAHAQPDEYMELPTIEYVDGHREHETAAFAAYRSVAGSFVAHGLLLSQSKRYAPAMAVKSDASAFCEQLQQCGYSTSPTYAHQLEQLIREFDLTQYDAEEQ